MAGGAASADLMLAEAAVRRLHACYADAVFRRDMASFGDCFGEHAEWRIAGRCIAGREEIVRFFGQAMAPSRRVVMSFGPPLVELAGGAVLARTCVTERNGLADGTGRLTIGTYFERLVQADGRLRRAWALFQLHYRGAEDMSGTWLDQPDYGPPPAFPPPDAIPN